MKSTPYSVKYQAFGAMYFDPGNLLTGPDLVRLWKTVEIFGNHTCHGNFWHQDNIPRAGNPRSFELGATSFFRTFLNRDSRPIFGGVSCGQPTRKTTDCDFHFSHTAAGRSFGYDTMPLFMIGVSGQWLERIGTQNYLDMIKDQFKIADSFNPSYGLIDVASSADCYSGYIYTPNFIGNAPLHRWSEQIRFLYACTKRRDQARGIYWGNYFGSAILGRLGGRERFLARFREQAQDVHGRPNAWVWEFPNGVFVSLCLDPLGCKPGSPLDDSAGQNLHWLLLELGSQGVLNPWA